MIRSHLHVVGEEAIRVETRFGTFDVGRESVVTFPEGLPGFERCHRFVLIASDELAPLRCVQGLDSPRPSFLTIDPQLVVPEYPCILGANDATRLDVKKGDTVLWLAIVSMPTEDSASANLRAPLVINPRRMIGYQIVPQDWFQPIAYPLIGR